MQPSEPLTPLWIESGRGFPDADALVAHASGGAKTAVALTPTTRDALEQLTAGYARRDLSRTGRVIASGIVVESIRKLLALDERLARAPELARTPVREPLVVVAPPRTASTALHRLLARHPAFTAPLPWETAYALPPEGAMDGRRARFAGALAAMRRGSRALFELHPVAADEPEECFALLETSLISPSFAYHGGPDAYLAWLDTLPPAAWDEAYRVYEQQLRLLAADRGGRRWLLKSGSHLHGLAAMLRALPGALVVQLHRPPAAALLSFCRLVEAHHTLYLRSVDRRSVGAVALAYLTGGLARAAAARRDAPGTRFLDLDAEAVAARPVEVAEEIAAFAGAPVDAETAALFRAWTIENPAPPARPTSSAELEGYGLDARAAAAAFEPYTSVRSRR